DDSHDVGELHTDELDPVLLDPGLDFHDARPSIDDGHQPPSSLRTLSILQESRSWHPCQHLPLPIGLPQRGSILSVRRGLYVQAHQIPAAACATRTNKVLPPLIDRYWTTATVQKTARVTFD